MILTPITSETEKQERFRVRRDINIPAKLFYAHLQGLECFVGKKVLEIGGTDDEDGNLHGYFTGMGAEYQSVRLEENKNKLPWVLPMHDFRDITSKSYDLIISLGVFERSDIDRSGEIESLRRYTRQQDLEKLFSLTNVGGLHIMGTFSDLCLYPNQEIAQAGFTLQHRAMPFYNLLWKSLGLDVGDKSSELLVMVR